MLEEVTVVAFGSQKRETLVGSITERVIMVNDRSRRSPIHPPFLRENTEEYETFSENRLKEYLPKSHISSFGKDFDQIPLEICDS